MVSAMLLKLLMQLTRLEMEDKPWVRLRAKGVATKGGNERPVPFFQLSHTERFFALMCNYSNYSMQNSNQHMLASVCLDVSRFRSK